MYKRQYDYFNKNRVDIFLLKLLRTTHLLKIKKNKFLPHSNRICFKKNIYRYFHIIVHKIYLELCR